MLLKAKITQLVTFLKKDIWQRSGHEGRSRRQAFLIRHLKIILLALRLFDQKRGRLHAASMTYYSILAIVPWLTLIYGLMKGFGLEGTLKDQLYHNLPSHRELINAVYNMAQSYVANMQGTLLAGIGLTVLIWGIVKTLTTMEDAFNVIWGINDGKPFARKLSDYLTVMLICPFLVILSGSVTVFVSIQLQSIAKNFHYLGPLISLIYAMLLLLPFCVIWMGFTFLYVFMPNTHVNIKSALWGGLIAGILYQSTQWCYIIFQVGITHANAIYGSLAAIPLFLVWLHVAWTIILFGSEIAFAHQYLRTYEFDPAQIKASPSVRKLTALLIMHRCVKNFEGGRPPQTVQQIAEHLYLPVGLVQQAVDDLVTARLLGKVCVANTKIHAYQPARTIDAISVHHVLDAIEHLGQENITFRETEELKIIAGHLNDINRKIRRSEEHVLLKDLT